MNKRITSALLVVVMCLAFLPLSLTAFASDWVGVYRQDTYEVEIQGAGAVPNGVYFISVYSETASETSVRGTRTVNVTTGTLNGIRVPVGSLESDNYSFVISNQAGSLVASGEVIMHSIELSQKTDYIFPELIYGYRANELTPLTVTVKNTGSLPTGPLDVTPSVRNNEIFTIDGASISSLAVGSETSFTIQPQTGLAVGTHTLTVTVSGGSGISASFDVSFTVLAQTYGISLSVTGTHTFPPQMVGYPTVTSLTVTVTNTGNQETGPLTPTLSGVNASSFSLIMNTETIPSLIPNQGFANFDVFPNTGLAPATYTAMVTVSGGSEIAAQSFYVSITVNAVPPNYSIEISQTTGHTFDAQTEGYSEASLDLLSVTVRNTGSLQTGDLSVVLSGPDASSFTASPSSITSIAISSESSFTVRPNVGLAAETYTATVTILGNNDISASFNVNFVVLEPPTHSIRLSTTGTHPFTPQTVGYTEASMTSLSVIVENMGTQPTGVLNVSLSGDNPQSFTLSTGTITGIDVGTESSFTVRPNVGLAVGNYTSTVTVSGGNGISESFDVSFTVNAAQEPPTHSISLSATGTEIFPAQTVGYGAGSITSLPVTVENTGNQPTGTLSVVLSGTNAQSFTLSTGTITGIAVGTASSFTVIPNIGLAAGNYTSTVTVSGGNGISESFDVSFTVNAAQEPQTYSISLSAAGTEIFPAQTVGYGAGSITSLPVTVENTGNQPTGTLSVVLSGTNAQSFTLSTGTITSIAVGTASSFTVRPNVGLAAGNYTSTVTVSGGNGISASFDVSFTVNAAQEPQIHSISLSATGTHIFPAQTVGYGAGSITSLPVTVENTGNQQTGTLSVVLSGANAQSFTLSTGTITGIAVGTATSFTVIPNVGLTAGTYTSTVTVSGGNDISASFNVSFTVNAAQEPQTYGISLSTTGTYTFPAQTVGYGADPVNSLYVTVTNTGNQPTGVLDVTLSGANPQSFTISPATIASIANQNGTSNLIVWPNHGLAVGTYTSVVTVSGGANITAQTFNVSFTVNPQVVEPTYGITLNQTAEHPFTAQMQGYSVASVSALNVAITNTGNQPTGALTVALSGAGAESFTLSNTTIPSIDNQNGLAAFTVRPIGGLEAGTYNATVTVSGGANITARTFDVSFTVTPPGVVPTYGITLSQTSAHTFPAQTEGYDTGSVTSLSVDVTNTGNQPTGALAVSLHGANFASFTLSTQTIGSIAAGTSTSFTIRPNDDLAVGTYNAAVTVSGGINITAQLFNVSFTVHPEDFQPTSGITLSITGTHTFAAQTVGYAQVEDQTVTVTNTGSQPTGDLTATLSGVNANSFTLSAATLGSIADQNGTAAFTVRPNTGLAAGTYNASVTVSGDENITAQSFDVSFTVNPSGGGPGPGPGPGPGTPPLPPPPVTPPTDPTGDVLINGEESDISVNEDGSVTIPADVLENGPVRISIPLGRSLGSTYVLVGPGGAIIPLSIYSETYMHGIISLPGTYQIVNNVKSFPDTDGHWGLPFISFVASRELFLGTDIGFEPDSTMTRAMFVTVLSRLEMIDPSDYEESDFEDVDEGMWYTAAVEWASSNGIVNGWDGLFHPYESITREQMATMLLRYIDHKGFELPQTADERVFSDHDDISSWAQISVYANQRTGIITGKPGNVFDPQGLATRAEVATVFARLVEALLAE